MRDQPAKRQPSGIDQGHRPGHVGIAPFSGDPNTCFAHEGRCEDERERLGIKAGENDLAAGRQPLDQDIERTAKKLGNADFVSRAKPEVVEENRERLAGAEAAGLRIGL